MDSKVYSTLMDLHKRCVPEMRFGQFMENLLGEIHIEQGKDPFYMDDDNFIECAKKAVYTWCPKKKPNKLEEVLMDRDGLTLDEAKDRVKAARRNLEDYTDVADFMEDEFGLEPDYFIDVIS